MVFIFFKKKVYNFFLDSLDKGGTSWTLSHFIWVGFWFLALGTNTVVSNKQMFLFLELKENFPILEMFWLDCWKKCGIPVHIETLWKHSTKTLGMLVAFWFFLLYFPILGKNSQFWSHIYRKQRYLRLYCKNKVFSPREHSKWFVSMIILIESFIIIF